MPESTAKKQRMDLAFAALLSDDDAAKLTALTRIEEQGDARAIGPLLTALTRKPAPAVEQRITSLLFQVKAADAVATLVHALRDPALRSVRRTALATFWNAGLDARDHLDRFIDIAIEGDAEECFECLTIIETRTSGRRRPRAWGSPGCGRRMRVRATHIKEPCCTMRCRPWRNGWV